jgi:hypothetical protein
MYKADAEIRKIGELGLQEPLEPWSSVIETDVAGSVVCHVQRFFIFIVLSLTANRNITAMVCVPFIVRF